MEAIGQKLLDFSHPFDVSLLDQVVTCMNDPKSPHQRIANQIMVALQEHQDSWTRASDILEQSKSPQTKYFGLQVHKLILYIVSYHNSTPIQLFRY